MLTKSTQKEILLYRTHVILDKKGYWMISSVHMIEIKNNPKENYQSYWGNLTFEL